MNDERKVALTGAAFLAALLSVLGSILYYQWRVAKVCESRGGYTVGRLFHFTPACVQPR